MRAWGLRRSAVASVLVPPVIAISKPAEDDEIDLLSSCDYYNEAASRLACQILVSKELTGIQVTVAPGE